MLYNKHFIFDAGLNAANQVSFMKRNLYKLIILLLHNVINILIKRRFINPKYNID